MNKKPETLSPKVNKANQKKKSGDEGHGHDHKLGEHLEKQFEKTLGYDLERMEKRLKECDFS